MSAQPALRWSVGGVQRFARRLLSGRDAGLVATCVVLVAIAAVMVPNFLTADNVQEIVLSVAVLAIVAVGEALVLITRSLDISVGSMVGLSAFVSADFAAGRPETNVVVVLALGIGVGVALGAINGVLVAVAEVPSIMATLGTLYVFRGADSLVAGSKQVTASTVPDWYVGLASDTVGGINPLIWIAAVVALAAGTWLRSSRSGRRLYALGSNPAAATAAGIHRRRLLFLAFAVCGGLCGLAGVLWGARYGTVTANAATGFELQVLAAVVVGGVSVLGGSGSVLGVVFGALLLGIISNALALLRVPTLWSAAIAGFVLLVAVTVDHLLRTRRRVG